MNHLYIYAAILSFLLSAILIAVFNKAAPRFNFVSRDRRIPYTGGLGFFLPVISLYFVFTLMNAVVLPFKLIWILIFAALLFIIGFIDDVRDFSLKAKIAYQVVFLLVFLYSAKKINIYIFPGWLNYVISFLWMTGILNAFNHLDVGDGVCAGVSLMAAASFLIIFLIKADLLLAAFFSILCGGLAAFLLFNFPPAKVFMGNSASHALGFLFGALAMYADYATIKNPFSLIAPLLILAVPIIDTSHLVFARVKKNIVPLKKSDDHIFLQLSAVKGFSHKKTLAIIYLLAFLWCAGGVAVSFGLSNIFLAFLIFALICTVWLVRKVMN